MKADFSISSTEAMSNNINRFFQQQLDMTNINDVLAAHFNDFLQRIVEAYIRPLKIKDSVPKYKVPILQILDGWLEDDRVLLAMSNAALSEKRFATLPTLCIPARCDG